MAHGRHPLHGLGGNAGITLGKFISDTCTTWVKSSRPRTAADTLDKLYRHFRTWYPEPLTAITVERVEAWKARRLNEGRSPSTVLRDLFTLSSVLRHAMKAGELIENPVRRVDKPRVDRRGKVRFLDLAEESRLRVTLKTERGRAYDASGRRMIAACRGQEVLLSLDSASPPEENKLAAAIRAHFRVARKASVREDSSLEELLAELTPK